MRQLIAEGGASEANMQDRARRLAACTPSTEPSG
jgi:hypothetical protein